MRIADERGRAAPDHWPQTKRPVVFVGVDLGAGSGRVLLAAFAPDEFQLEEVHRFHYPATRRDRHLRWDIQAIFREIKTGLRDAGARARARGCRVTSIGVDSWGVDYGLIGADGGIVEDPICYRDDRTRTAMADVFALRPREEIYARTGIQFLPFNTLFQLFAHHREGLPEDSRRLLLIPDLVNFLLSGRAVTEYTNATTTQMLLARSGQWDFETLSILGLPSTLLQEIVPAGTVLGELTVELAAELDLNGVFVVAPATHDTGSAVAGTPLADGWAYISSGTWSLVGVECDVPHIDNSAALENFTNEGGAFGTVRFLKNVMGLWILESCRREWEADGLRVGYAELLAEIEKVDCSALIYPDDRRFLNPPSMVRAIAEQLAETGQAAPADPPSIAKLILDSLAFRYGSVLRRIETLTGRKLAGVHIVGGGSRNGYLNQMTSNVANLPVRAGPTEATAIGNVLVQAIAAGVFPSLGEARRHVAGKTELQEFAPRRIMDGAARARCYAELEERYANMTNP